MKKFAFFFLAITGNLFSQINLNTGLTACYPFAGNAVDQINALNGVINGSVTLTTDRFGNPNQAYSFPGVGTSNIELPNDPLLKPTNYISFSAWLKPGIISNPTQYVLFTKNTGSSNFETYALTLSYSGVFTAVKSYTNGVTKEAISTTTAIAGTWYHVAMTIGNDSLKIWVNGVLKSTATTTMTFNYQAGKNIYLGSTNESSYYRPYNGVIDNPRFYNRKLNGDEVNALYVNDPSCFALGITAQEKGLNVVSVYPNPSTGKLQLKNIYDSSVEIVDVLGKKVDFSLERTDETSSCINIKIKGLYFVKISSRNESKVFKIIIE